MPRTQESPTYEELLDSMTVGEPYWAGELASNFDTTRRTVQRRLSDLVVEGKIQKKSRGSRRVVYWKPSEVGE